MESLHGNKAIPFTVATPNYFNKDLQTQFLHTANTLLHAVTSRYLTMHSLQYMCMQVISKSLKSTVDTKSLSLPQHVKKHLEFFCVKKRSPLSYM